MSKEIKFRAWDKLFERWVYISLPRGDIAWGDYEWDKSNLEPWQQFTDLKCRKGVDIYEGDIVKTLLHYAEVKHGWFSENIKESYKQKLYGWYIEDGGWQFNLNEHLEVVGNVYENKELILKESK